jgi:hypothetical protein
MSATAPRTISNAPDVRQLGVAVGALILAVALVVAVTVSRQASSTSTAPLAAPVPVLHDHGWSESAPIAGAAHDNGWATTDSATTSVAAPGLVIRGTNGGGILYTGIPSYQPTFVVTGTNGGGIQYTGIPYSAPDSTPIGGGRGTRFAR